MQVLPLYQCNKTQSSQTIKIETKSNTSENRMDNERIVNGVSVTNLIGTLSAMIENPDVSKFNFRVRGRWISGGGHKQTTINDFYGACQRHTRSQDFVLHKDEPQVLSGTDQGGNPVEYYPCCTKWLSDHISHLSWSGIGR